MSFIDFLNSLSNGVTLFFTTMGTIANYLITNYIFLVILGVTLTLSLISYLFVKILKIPNFINYDLDDTKHSYFSFTKILDNVLDRKKERDIK